MRTVRSFFSSLALASCAAASLPSHAGLVANGSGLPDCGAGCAIAMTNYGGPVMTGNTNIYIIWYGDWSNAAWNPAQTLLPQFFGALTGSDYMNIALTYDDGHGTHVSNQITFAGAVNRAADLGNNLSDADIVTLVQDAQGGIVDPKAVYFVYTAPGIRQEEDTQACGWHSNFGATKYSWVSAAPDCDFLTGSVTGNDYVDSLTETTSHELFEALTDPEVGDAFDYAPPLAWYDQTYAEVGDMCIFSNFAANLNGGTFDVQAIWARDSSRAQGGMCAAGFTADTAVPEPATLALVAPLLGLLGLRRRSARQAAATAVRSNLV